MDNYDEVIVKAKEWAESATYDDKVDMYLMRENGTQAYVKVCEAMGVRKYFDNPVQIAKYLKYHADRALSELP